MQPFSPPNTELEESGDVDTPSDPPVERAGSGARVRYANANGAVQGSHFGGGRAYACPRCGSRFIRRHRRFADRLLSVFSPVRRYRCTSARCRYECNVPKSGSRHRPFARAAGLVGLALACVFVAAGGLYLAADPTTRSGVMDAYSSLIRYESDARTNPHAVPVPHPSNGDLQYETVLSIEPSSTGKPGDLALEFIPPLPGLAPREIEPANLR